MFYIFFNVRFYHCTASTLYLQSVDVCLFRVTLNINRSSIRY